MNLKLFIFLAGIVFSESLFASDIHQTQGCMLSTDPAASFHAQADTSLEVRNSWSNREFSMPENHNPKRYRYIVHMVDLRASMYTPEAILNYLKSVSTRECSALSVSLIDQNRNRTFGGVGFILSIPAENFLVARNADMGTISMSNNNDPKVFNEYINYYYKSVGPLPTPDELLANTNPNRYNEILIQGKNLKGFKIVGIIIKTGERSDFAKEMALFAKRNSIPVVRF